MKLGCRCDVCPLRDEDGPVFPERHPEAQAVFVGEFPKEQDVNEGRPFTDVPGTLLTNAAKAAGFARQDIYWTTTVLCRPPKNDMSLLLDKVKAQNRQIKKVNQERLKDAKATGIPKDQVPQEPFVITPMDACKARLKSDLSVSDNWIVGGSLPIKAVIGPAAKMFDMRGGPITATREGRELRIMPSISPGLVAAQRRWLQALNTDFARAARFFDGTLNWDRPHITYYPKAHELRAFLQKHSVLSSDVETDARECLTAMLRCIAIGTDKEVMVMGLRPKSAASPLKDFHENLGVDTFFGFYPEHDLGPVLNVLREWLVDPTKVKVGHNFGYYDFICIAKQLGVKAAPIIDTMLLHRLAASELPHSLGFVGSMYTDAPSWKTTRDGRKKALDAETDHELHEYCALDVSVTHAALPQLLEEVALREQEEVMACDHKLQYICAGMHWNGMYVDQERRLGFEVEQVKRLEEHKRAVAEIAGRALNPGSTQQLRQLLFTEWRLNPDLEDKVKFTKKGDLSTSDSVIMGCLRIKSLRPDQLALLESVRYYRKAQKNLGTYITKLRPSTDLAFGWDEEEEYEEALFREQRGEQRKGIVDPRTGRMYPGYNAHVATTGRLSSSSPINAQNFPGWLRAMVRAAPGHMFVGADADQLELRIAASRWNSTKYLEAFEAELDPHSSVTALSIFGERFIKAAGCPPPWPTGTKFKGDAKKLRNLAKVVQYASQYWATLKMIHRIISETEQGDPDDPSRVILPYLRIKMKQVRLMYEKWLEGAQFEAGWESELALFRDQSFLLEPVMGRRRDFLDGENRNELVNFPIQGAGASLMNLAIIKVVEEIPFEKWGPGTGIVNQCHDSIMVECPLDGATLRTDGTWDVPRGSIPWRVKHIIEEAMNQTHPGLPGVRFTATADYGLYWNEV
jgi:DNA polymerase I-like protein with 3'-5' exonuclease and polymerase domains/uracil-DNA glycosylase